MIWSRCCCLHIKPELLSVVSKIGIDPVSMKSVSNLVLQHASSCGQQAEEVNNAYAAQLGILWLQE